MSRLAIPISFLGSGLVLGLCWGESSPTALAGGAGGVPPFAKGRFPPSGQTKCYDSSGNQVPRESAAYPGQDGLYQAGCASEGRFADHGDGTVTDACTGLMWQKDAPDIDGDGSLTEQDVLPWGQALEYSEHLSLAGHDDWRLPNVRELQSIVDYGRFDPSLDPVSGSSSWPFWSSTSVANQPRDAWVVYFGSGWVGFYNGKNVGSKETGHGVRAVRG